jgi:hypothetical protein
MATVFMYKHEPDTRHIALYDYNAAAAIPKGTLIVLGNKAVMLDENAAAGINRILTVSENGVFEAGIGDVDGTIAVGAACYLSSAGKITGTATNNTYLGFVVYKDAEVIRFAS